MPPFYCDDYERVTGEPRPDDGHPALTPEPAVYADPKALPPEDVTIKVVGPEDAETK